MDGILPEGVVVVVDVYLHTHPPHTPSPTLFSEGCYSDLESLRVEGDAILPDTMQRPQSSSAVGLALFPPVILLGLSSLCFLSPFL